MYLWFFRLSVVFFPAQKDLQLLRMGVDKYPHPSITWTYALHIDNSPHVIWDKPFFTIRYVLKLPESATLVWQFLPTNTGPVRQLG